MIEAKTLAVCFSVVMGGFSHFAWADSPFDLLDLSTFDAGMVGLAENTAIQIAHLTDGDLKSVAVFESIDGAPVDLLFAFDSGTVAPDSFRFFLPDNAQSSAPARIDLLASTSSPSSGFGSLRTELIDPLKPQQNARFESAAANWLLVRLYPADGSEQVALAELSIGGKEGLPETSYAFGETPAEALEIISAMQDIGAADLNLTQAEAEIFERAKKGELSNAEFVEISLLASGVTDLEARSRYIARIDALTQDARVMLASNATPAQAGSQVLAFLHERAFHGGYLERQTNLSTVLDEGVFNCVSSAVLYNAVAGGLGFDVRAIEVPDHAFSIMYDGLDHMDIETTTAQGFDLRRDKVSEFENLTGFRYIPRSNKTKRREIDAAGLAAIIYYNHGVQHLKDGRYQDALFANFRAMSLDPEFASAATNALAALGRWSRTLADDDNWQDAIEVAAVASRLAPKDQGLIATRKSIWQRWAFSEADAGRPKAALDILTKAALEVDREAFDSMRSAVITRPAEALIKSGDWQAALDLTAGKNDLLGPDARQDLEGWRTAVFQRWVHAELDSGQFQRALEVLIAGHKANPSNRDLDRTARYLAQEWAKADGFPDGLTAFQSILAALPQVDEIDRIAETFVQRHVRAGLETSDLTVALTDVHQSAQVVGPEIARDLTAFAYEAYGHGRIDAQDWAGAAAIYSEGRIAIPESDILSRNARYVAQEWQRQASGEGGVAELQEVQRALRTLFPEFAVDPGFGEDEIVRQVNAALSKGDYLAAEETLASSQLLIRPETFHKLRTVVFDRQARDAMDAGDWAKAARIYHGGHLQMGDQTLFARNIAYIAQEWTRDAAKTDGAAGVAATMEQLLRLFPEDEDVAGMGLATFERLIAGHVEAGEFEQAKDIVRQARKSLTQEETRDLLIALYARAGSKAIDQAQWDAALMAYADGLALAPDARDLSRNLPFVLQEWSATALANGGAPLLVSELARMQEILPDARALPDVLENVLGRALSEKVDAADPRGALELIRELTIALPNDLAGNLKVIVYDRWAKTKFDIEAWQEAIDIYDEGLLEVPQSGLMENNRKYAQSKL